MKTVAGGIYHRAQRLGEGSFGSVCTVYDDDGEVYAMKIFNEEDDDENADGSLDVGVLREISALRVFMNSKAEGGFGHENVMRIHDVTMMEGSLCIAMPKMAMSVGGAIDSKVLNRQKMIKISHGVMSALCFLHANGMIHRDVKSDNIMLDEDWNAQIIDFSLTKVLPLENDGIADGERTHTPEVGTATYVAPEVYAKLPYGFKSDVYSAGVVLLEMFVGARLQTDRDKAALVLVQKKKNELPPSDKPLPALLRALLEEDPTTRLSCRQVLGDSGEGASEGTIKIVGTISKLWTKNSLPTSPPPVEEQRVLEAALKSLVPAGQEAGGCKKRKKAGGRASSPASSVESRVQKACAALGAQCASTEPAAVAYARSTLAMEGDESDEEAVPPEYCAVMAMKMFEESLPNLEDAAIDLEEQCGFEWDEESYLEAEYTVLKAMNHCLFVAPASEGKKSEKGDKKKQKSGGK